FGTPASYQKFRSLAVREDHVFKPPSRVTGCLSETLLDEGKGGVVPSAWLQIPGDALREIDHDADNRAIDGRPDDHRPHGSHLAVHRGGRHTETPQTCRHDVWEPVRKVGDVTRRQQDGEESERAH